MSKHMIQVWDHHSILDLTLSLCFPFGNMCYEKLNALGFLESRCVVGGGEDIKSQCKNSEAMSLKVLAASEMA